MCSRYSLTSPPEAVRSYFRTVNKLDFPPRYNIAPAQPMLIVRTGLNGEREQALVRWGLIPAWVKDPRKLTTLINARSETAADKPSFRGPMRHRRALVPTDGFYEWTGRAGAKRPHLIRATEVEEAGSHLMGLAGIWETWLGADGSEIEMMAILTTAANATVAPIHDRMPVIVAAADFDRWLDCSPGSAAPVAGLLQPAPAALLEVIAVHPRLNNVRNEGPELWQPPPDTVGTRLI